MMLFPDRKNSHVLSRHYFHYRKIKQLTSTVYQTNSIKLRHQHKITKANILLRLELADTIKSVGRKIYVNYICLKCIGRDRFHFLPRNLESIKLVHYGFCINMKIYLFISFDRQYSHTLENWMWPLLPLIKKTAWNIWTTSHSTSSQMYVIHF